MAMKGFNPKWKDLADHVIGMPGGIRQGRGIDTLHQCRTRQGCKSGPAMAADNYVRGVSYAEFGSFGTERRGLRRASVTFDVAQVRTRNFLHTGAA